MWAADRKRWFEDSYIINGKPMYREFTNKKGCSVLRYIEKLGRDSRIYSEKRNGLCPLLSQHECYVYATERELAIVLICKDSVKGMAKKELESDLALTCELFRHRLLHLTKNIPHVFGVIVDAEEGNDFPVNSDKELPVAFPLMFLFEAEFSENDILYASHHLQSKNAQFMETPSQEEIAAELGINLEDFGLK